jgi:hypothetical protein
MRPHAPDGRPRHLSITVGAFAHGLHSRTNNTAGSDPDHRQGPAGRGDIAEAVRGVPGKRRTYRVGDLALACRRDQECHAWLATRAAVARESPHASIAKRGQLSVRLERMTPQVTRQPRRGQETLWAVSKMTTAKNHAENGKSPKRTCTAACPPRPRCWQALQVRDSGRRMRGQRSSG